MAVSSTTVYENKLAGKRPAVTIGIPTYKRGAYLGEAIESALRQRTAVAFEVIVVDNNPERGDETERFMERYREVEGVSYYKNDVNVGMTGNFNSVYTHGQGEWVVLLHDDDMLYPEYLELIFGRWRLHERYDVVYPPYEVGAVPSDHLAGEPKNYLHEGRLDEMLRGNVFGPPSCFASRRDFMVKAGGFDEAWYPSLAHELFSRLLRNGARIAAVGGRPLSLYRKGVNESLKEETLLKFDELDEQIFEAVLRAGVCRLKRPLWRMIHLHLRYVGAVNKLEWNPGSVKIKALIAEIEGRKTLLSRLVFAVYYKFCHRRKADDRTLLE